MVNAVIVANVASVKWGLGRPNGPQHRYRAPLIGALVASLAAASLVLAPPIGPAGATSGATSATPTRPGTTQITSTQQEASSLEATIAQQEQQSAALSQRFDAAQQQIDTLQAELAVTESRLLRIRSQITTDRARLAKDAVRAYMFGDVATQIAAVFSTSANGIDDRVEYENTVIGDVSADAASLGQAESSMTTDEAHQKAEVSGAQAAAQQAEQLRQSNEAATAQTEATLQKVQGTLAQEVAAAARAKAIQEAAAAQAARSAAAAQAAAAQAAAAATVVATVDGSGTSTASITAANQAAAAASHDQGGTPSGAGTPTSVGGSGSSNSAGLAAVRAAISQLGVPYVWGGETPGIGFDCSGLTQWAWAQAGVSIPRTAASQYAAVPHVALNDLEPGDLLFYFNLDGDGIVDHVVMFVGSGPYGSQTIIQAPETGETVSYSPLFTFGLIGAGQP